MHQPVLTHKSEQNTPGAARRQTGPHKRKKVALACVICRGRKIRCDGQRPTCGNCLRKGESEKPCTYHVDHSRSPSDSDYIQLLEDRIREFESNRPADATGLFSHTRVDRDGGPFPASDTLHSREQSTIGSVDAAVPVPSFSRGRAEPVPNCLERPFIGEVLPSSEIQPSHNGHPQSFHDLEAPQKSMDTSSDQEDHRCCDHSVSAMGAASHICDRVTTAQEVFFGNSSAVSFQHQVRETLQRSTGKSNLLRPNSSAMKPHKRPLHDLSSIMDQVSGSRLEALTLPPRALADYLLDLYWNRVHCLYPFVHKPSFLESYEQLWIRESAVDSDYHNSRQAVGLGGSDCGSTTFSSALNAIFALGCQFSDMPSEEREKLTTAFFCRSKHFLHIDILDKGNLALVQLLLIMAQFLQSTHCPDQCWNIAGLACRVAQGIGLYVDETNDNRSAIEIEMRRRAWYGCVMLDIVVSMALGRPPMTSGQSDVPLPMAVNDDSLDSVSPTWSSSNTDLPHFSFFVQAIKLNKILAEILTDVYKPWSHVGRRNQVYQQLRSNSFDTIIKLDSTLSDFEAALPNQLRWTQPNRAVRSTEIVDRQVNVLHARFTHLKLLLYRPIFKQLCIESKLEGCTKTSGDFQRHDIASNMLYSHFASRCAATCLSAAEDLIDIIDHSTRTTATGAWWYNVFYLFSSAIVLLLAELCPTALEPGKSNSIRHSWNQCQATLGRISLHNDAAAQCARTLCSMREQIFPKSNAQKAGRNSNTQNSATTAYLHSVAMESGVQNPEQTLVYEATDGQGVVDNEFLFFDMQIGELISQGVTLQHPWNLDDIAWGSVLPQNNSRSLD